MQQRQPRARISIVISARVVVRGGVLARQAVIPLRIFSLAQARPLHAIAADLVERPVQASSILPRGGVGRQVEPQRDGPDGQPCGVGRDAAGGAVERRLALQVSSEARPHGGNHLARRLQVILTTPVLARSFVNVAALNVDGPA